MLAQWRVRTELALPELEAYPLSLVTVLRWCETPWPAAAGGDLASATSRMVCTGRCRRTGIRPGG